jgi:hypothetical protein
MSKNTEVYYFTIKGQNVRIFWSEKDQGYELRINNVVIDHFFSPEGAESYGRQVIDIWEEEGVL